MDIETELAKAVHTKRLRAVVDDLLGSRSGELSEAQRRLLQRARDACSRIREACLKELKALSLQLRDEGIPHRAEEEELEGVQTHEFAITLRGTDPRGAVAAARKLGYRPERDLSEAQWEVFRRSETSIVLTRQDDVTTRSTLRWPPPTPWWWRPPVRPTVDDAGLLRLPRWLWPMSLVVRPAGVTLRRLGLVGRGEPLGEFLGTPTELIPRLLDLAALTSDDVVVDLGCGDGRVLVEAATRFSCRAVGYETRERLCVAAKTLASDKGVSDLVTVHHADAWSANLEDATVLFLFLPPPAVCGLVPSLLDRVQSGARVIAHEQSPIDCHPRPSRSAPLFGSSSLTVAHLWTP